MVTTASDGATVENFVLEVLREAQLTEWQQQIIFDLQIRRCNHFSVEQDKEFRRVGMSPEEIRRLRTAVRSVDGSNRQKGRESSMVYVRKEPTSTAPNIDPNKTIITKEQIKLMETIGEGTFAVVKRALWYSPDGKKVDVAVKILRDVSPLVMEDLQVEAGHLLKLQHPHLIRLYGVVQHPAMMVFELCEGGSLLERLRDTEKPVPLFTALLAYCLQIVKAMAYLEAKHCVHRDLAARNILLTSDEKLVKICDFGLMRALKDNEELYIMGPAKRVPFSWCPPESLKHRKFSHASDVWAFGVTVWELFSLGEEPWIGCRAIEVLKRLDAGERLEKPFYCSQQIYDIIQLCWNVDPEKRPKFSQLKGYQQQAQFNIAEVRDPHPHNDKRALDIKVGDRIIVTENTGVIWSGQNERTRKLGTFLRSAVFVHGKDALSNSTSHNRTAGPSTPIKPLPPTPMAVPSPSTSMSQDWQFEGSRKISRPVQGSFIHTGHADVRGGNSWGQPGVIDDIYLKNPVRGSPMEPGIKLTAPTPAPSSSRPVPTRTAPPPPSPKDLKFRPAVPPSSTRPPGDPLHPDWGDFEKALSPSFSPSQIDLPTTSASTVNTTREIRYPTPPHGVSASRSARDVWASSSAAQPPARPEQPSIPNHSRGAVIFPTGTGVGRVVMPTTAPKMTTNIGSNPNFPLTTPSSAMRNSPPTVLGNGVTRSPVSVQPVLRPTPPYSVNEGRQNANHTPPPLNADRFVSTVIYPTPTAGGSQNAVPLRREADNTRVPSSSSQQPSQKVVGFDPNVMAELNKKLNNGTPGGTVRLRPVSAVNPHQPMLTVNASGITTTTTHASGPDPFTVPSSVQNVVQKERYNQILEKKSNALQKSAPSLAPSNTPVRPHSTMGIPISQQSQPLPCLIPTQMPIPSKTVANNETYRAAVSQNPLRPNSNASNQRPPDMPPSVMHQPKPLTVVLPPPSTVVSLSSAPLYTPSTQTSAGSSTARSTQPEPPQPTSTSGTSRSTGNANGARTGLNASPPQILPSPSAVSHVPAGTLPRAASSTDRRSRVEEEISTMLPTPSQLFYGTNDSRRDTNGTTNRSETAVRMPRPSSTSSLPRPSSLAQGPVQVPASVASVSAATAAATFPSPPPPLPTTAPPKSTDPLPISLKSVLQPTRLPVNYPQPSPPPVAVQPTRNVDISSIMNAYHSPVAQPYVHPTAYSAPSQMPIFALSNNSQQPPIGMYGNHMPMGLPSMQPRAIGFTIGPNDDIIEALDPCRVQPPSESVPSTSSGSADSFVTRANQMEVLYKEASFADPSRCDEMVNKCSGDIAVALKELKMDWLVDTGIATNKGKAFTALESNGWDLNRAAEGLVQ